MELMRLMNAVHQLHEFQSEIERTIDSFDKTTTDERCAFLCDVKDRASHLEVEVKQLTFKLLDYYQSIKIDCRN